MESVIMNPECIICYYEIKEVILSNRKCHIIKNCFCNYDVHYNCLLNYYMNVKKKCLICEKPVIIFKKLSFKEKCKKIFCCA